MYKISKVKECRPKLEKLLNILEPTSFKGIEYESSISHELLYDWHRLKNEIQASEAELIQALNNYLITNIDGSIFFIKIIMTYLILSNDIN